MEDKEKFKFFKKKRVKISVSKELVKQLIEQSNNMISKKDLGRIFNKILADPKKLIDNEVKDYIEHKYDIAMITGHLRKSNKNVIAFKKLMEKLSLSKRKFYPRLSIIQNFYTKSKTFRWSIERGRFIRKEEIL